MAGQGSNAGAQLHSVVAVCCLCRRLIATLPTMDKAASQLLKRLAEAKDSAARRVRHQSYKDIGLLQHQLGQHQLGMSCLALHPAGAGHM
jgi:hypothetical protein